jgi:GTP 3',8-cyclase
MGKGQLYDSLGRRHNYLRLSLTDACNLRCSYCLPNETIAVTPSRKMMSVDEIVHIASLFVGLGINKIRLTGGEPLLRKEAKLILERLSTLKVELSITTNAILVEEFLAVFHSVGIRTVNVSLDTLQPEEFLRLTKRGEFEKIKKNIHTLLAEGFKVKINVVVMKGINESAVLDFMEWTKDFSLEVRFIEFMPFSGNDWNRDKVISMHEMIASIQKKYPLEPLPDGPNATAKMYSIPGHRGSFGFISTVTEPFCATCNRLRLTADGKLKNCLFSEGETDLLTAFRAGQDLEPLIRANVSGKKASLGGRFDFEKIENRSMIKIGG